MPHICVVNDIQALELLQDLLVKGGDHASALRLELANHIVYLPYALLIVVGSLDIWALRRFDLNIYVHQLCFNLSGEKTAILTEPPNTSLAQIEQCTLLIAQTCFALCL